MTHAATDTPTTTGPAAPGGAPVPAVERPGSLPTKTEMTGAARDRTLTSPVAVELARRALGEITEPLSVGRYTASKLQAERLVTHLFECNLAGYVGWRWAVTMSRPPRGRTATICEMELLPGEDALLAPAWVPWADRLRPGDVSRADRLPRRETDERLEPGWEATGDEGDEVALDELDLGRARVLSPEGIRRAAQRWYDGDHGPEAEGVRRAQAACSTCGFLLPVGGPLRPVFGVCANEWAPDDGRVVSLDHGCGAHSETDLADQGPEWPIAPSRLDEAAMVPLGTDGASIRQGRGREDEVAEAAEEGADEPEPTEPAESAEEGREPSQEDAVRAGAAGDSGDTAERAAAVREAVADLEDLQQGLGPAEGRGSEEPTSSSDSAALPSLAELEAHLPTRSPRRDR